MLTRNKRMKINNINCYPIEAHWITCSRRLITLIGYHIEAQ